MIASAVRVLENEVCLDRSRNTIALGLAGLPDHFAGDAEYERVRRNPQPFRANGSGSDDRAGAHVNTIQEDGAHRDEAIVFDGRSVNDGAMSDGDALPDPGGNSIIYVDDRSILDVAVLPDLDGVGVGPNDCRRPHRDVRTEGHVADDDGEGVDEGQGVEGGQGEGGGGRGEGVCG